MPFSAADIETAQTWSRTHEDGTNGPEFTPTLCSGATAAISTSGTAPNVSDEDTLAQQELAADFDKVS